MKRFVLRVGALTYRFLRLAEAEAKLEECRKVALKSGFAEFDKWWSVSLE
jgi:hypothetical protein